MHLFKDTVGVFALAIVSVNAVTPDAVTTNPTVGPTVITEDKMGAATFVDGYNSTLVVYQALDGSISGLSGAGSPVTELSYTTSVILAAGVARNDTPLAVAVAYGFFNVAHLFYLSAAECSGGNYLYELVDDPYDGWTDGPLNNLQVCSSSLSNLLFALGPHDCLITNGEVAGGGSGGSLRVGYMCAYSDYLCEAYQTSSGNWTTTQY